MNRRVLGAGLTALAVGGALAASSAVTAACTTHQCDTDFVNIDQSAGTFVGDVQPVGPGTALWESSPIEGTWIDFPPERTYFFSLPQGFTPIGGPVPYIATGPTPADPGDGGQTYTLASGELAEMGPYVNGGFTITNATCAEYYLYVSVYGSYDPPAAPAAADGGAE